MRRILLASLIALAPGLALAQSADSNPPPAPPGADDGWAPPPDGAGGFDGHDHKKGHWGGPEQFLTDFYAANTTHDGHLTLAQAQAANFKPVVDHFSDIDVAKRGYVTFYDIQAWRLDDLAKHLEARAAELRAKD